jgi:hypothetical protein
LILHLSSNYSRQISYLKYANNNMIGKRPIHILIIYDDDAISRLLSSFNIRQKPNSTNDRVNHILKSIKFISEIIDKHLYLTIDFSEMDNTFSEPTDS